MTIAIRFYETLSIFWGTIGIRHSLNGISVITEEHDGHSGNLSDSSLEIFITGSHDIGLVLSHSVDQTVVSVGPLQTEDQDKSDKILLIFLPCACRAVSQTVDL